MYSPINSRIVYLSDFLFITVFDLALGIQSTTLSAQLACTDDLKAPELLGDENESLAVGIRWCRLIGAPSVDDPNLVGSSSFKSMLWHLHKRASEESDMGC